MKQLILELICCRELGLPNKATVLHSVNRERAIIGHNERDGV